MSKKNKKRSPELPQVGNALEVPNYVIPTTDLEYKETVNGTRNPAEAQNCGDNCGNDCSRGENCGRNCKN